MNIFRTVSLALLVLMMSATAAHAAPAPTVSPKTNTSLIEVATVDIKDAKIVSQRDNAIDLSFTLTNREGAQSGVKYGVKLLQMGDKKQSVVDSYVYDDALALGAGSSVDKTVTYTAPSSLSGTYAFALTSQNEDGFPFANVIVGNVTFKGSGGVELIADTCSATTGAVTSGLNRVFDVDPAKGLRVTCTAINHANVPVSVVPTITTTLRSEYGATVDVPGSALAPIAFTAGEKKTFTVIIPLATDPQIYSVQLGLASGGVTSNRVISGYLIKGASATIVNASLDKDYYSEGSVATVTFTWQGMGMTDIPTLTTSLTDDRGNACATVSTRPLPNKVGGTLGAFMFMTSNCYNPHLTAMIKSADGTVLDQKDFAMQTVSTGRHMQLPDMRFVGLIFGIIVITAVAIYIIRKRKGHMPPTAIVALMIATIVGYGAFTTESASANTFAVRGNGYVYMTVSMPTSFVPGDPIQVNGQITSYSSDVVDVYLDATTNGVTKKIVDYGTFSGVGSVSGSVIFTAGAPGSSTVSLNAGENTVVAPPPYAPDPSQYFVQASSAIEGVCEVSFEGARTSAEQQASAQAGARVVATFRPSMDNGCARTGRAYFEPGAATAGIYEYDDGAGYSDFRCGYMYNYCGAVTYGDDQHTDNQGAIEVHIY